MTSAIVNQATIAELEDVAALFNEYRIFYGQESDPDGAKKFLFDRFEHGESVIFIARDEEGGQAIGFTQLYPSFSSVSMKRIWILNDLFVTEKRRKRGAAQSLLQAAEEYAVRTKSKGLELATAPDNERAQRLYVNNGYKKDEEFYHYYLHVLA
ncbi:GNAT family N-acetyltransferase [Cohnella thailandensis]|uniref:GNAT family N-acetyltransferase n=1 Tax=Cohnella thailandensis TaxID=557557 RepID=A0A841T3L2_9BACL|nr:GNAT family N-acetyltransferase [Cohnella thailandensis]MBB6637215.1 GNAT family N-acetyltransferase [Cohnella thailandensis]MBP1976963.1 ribosomal protein S18 acetylase RimI-like enzyme [Cohnella thailandensis]